MRISPSLFVAITTLFINGLILKLVWQPKSSGCLPHERAWLDHIYDELGYVDTFRVVRTEAELYSWWSNRGQARAKM